MASRGPQDLVFSLFGEYLLDHPDAVWVGSLIELLAPFDLSENAVRTVLSRMSRKGWLRSERRGRTAWYDLTPRGRRLLEEGAERIYHPPRDEPWDGSWHLVNYSIPEDERELRDRLRVRLTWLGCGSLGGGLWITPHDLYETLSEVAAELGVEEHVEIFRAEHLGFSDDETLVARCWDLSDIHERYSEFILRHRPGLHEAREAASRGGIPSDEAYVRRFELIHEYREFPAIDPFLPRELEPPDWGGECAAWLFETYRDLLTQPADRYVDRVLSTAPATAAVTA